jgi:enterochelin esterase-like enzyme
LLIFAAMPMEKLKSIIKETVLLQSKLLLREVTVDFYFPKNIPNPLALNLLLINDGQDMEKLGLVNILETLTGSEEIEPLFCAGIHAAKDRKMEYGMANSADYLGRGASAGKFTAFVFEELLPYIRKKYGISSFREKAYAGFSLGGLMALDIVWNHPHEFTKVGVFSGSLWWRSKDLDDGYDEDTDRLMQAQIRKGEFHAWQKFYFTTGSQDEVMDRNNNGVIDSIDDTNALIDELEKLGYKKDKHITYINYEDGKHDVPTWGRAMPAFLKWGWGSNGEVMD